MTTHLDEKKSPPDLSRVLKIPAEITAPFQKTWLVAYRQAEEMLAFEKQEFEKEKRRWIEFARLAEQERNDLLEKIIDLEHLLEQSKIQLMQNRDEYFKNSKVRT
jgi:hypothetical protein